MIYFDNRQEKIEINEEFERLVEEIVQFALKEEEVDEKVQISIVFVDNKEIREINNETRGIDKETDVLSFPMLDYEDGKVFKEQYKNFSFDETYYDGEELVLGDVVLSLEKSLEQSEEYNHSFKRETSYLIIHSILHLLGYDHMEDNEKGIMRKREEDILNKLNIKRD
ncbi:rRNA maturation RNase YbeY [Clostridium paridis]|uniref:Endoribonuclease YbeY n=1 Tax=Clostridium paridis TaxID=2803863 RepID=A0A937FFF4_9CLOT|nr:rRNA maturation RNase YbeY [Clostridium paridis]MBL4933005.1 rRNA maturation RNase YbeY [Clostridium paridis]